MNNPLFITKWKNKISRMRKDMLGLAVWAYYPLLHMASYCVEAMHPIHSAFISCNTNLSRM